MKKTAVEIEKIFNMDEPIGVKDTLQSALLRTQDAILEGMMPIPPYYGDAVSWGDANHKSRNDITACWQAAQAALLAKPMVIDLRGLEWPEWSDGIRVMFCNKKAMEFQDKFGTTDFSKYENIKKIPRPAPAWQPKEGEWVWRVEITVHSMIRYSRSCEGTFFAKPIDHEAESFWTRIQFRARGEYLEIIP